MATTTALLESIALAEDRSKPAKALLEGSCEALCHAILQAQLTDDYKTEQILIEQLNKSDHQWSEAGREAKRRYELRRYRADSTPEVKAAVCDQLVSDLGVRFDFSKTISRDEVASDAYPSRLDPIVIAPATLLPATLAQSSSNIGSVFTPLSYDWLATQTLDPYQVISLLHEQSLPTLPNLPTLIYRDIVDMKRTFGALNIHRQLTLIQLEELQKLHPPLATDLLFVGEVLSRKQPKTPLDTLDIKEQTAFYEEQWAYALTLAPVFNNIKTVLFYHCLLFDRKRNALNFDKFRLYLQMPFRYQFPHQDLFSRTATSDAPVYWADFGLSVGQLRGVGSDTDLIRFYLSQWFLDASHNEIAPWAALLDNGWLNQLLAETKLTIPPAAPTAETKGPPYIPTDDAKSVTDGWLTLLGPSNAATLRARVDIEFAHDNPKIHEVKGEVKIDVWTKNVPSLIVKLFKINTRGYYRAKNEEVDCTVTLDGLTAHEETTHDFSAAGPLARVRRTLEFPSLTDQKGVFIVEVLGNGVRARALIRKGQVTFLEHRSAYGHMFRLFDETGAPIPGSIFINGHTYESDAKTGIIIAPYSNVGVVRQAMILSSRDGELVSLAHFQHLKETYTFECGLYVDRESVLQKSQSELVLRPVLSVNGLPTTLDTIKKTRLKIDSVNDEGVPTSVNVEDFKFVADQETVHVFNVPDNLRSLTFTVSIDVKPRSNPETQTITVSRRFGVNSIDDSSNTEDLFLRFNSTGYSVNLLGKAGEARRNRRVVIDFTSKYVTAVKTVEMQTDETGSILLGALVGITAISARVPLSGASTTSRRWELHNEQASVRSTVHSQEGVPIRIPYRGRATAITASDFALFEIDQISSKPRVNLTAVNLALAISAGQGRGSAA